MSLRKEWLRGLGLFLFGFLLWQIDLPQLFDILSSADLILIGITLLLTIPQIGLKTARWHSLLRCQQIQFGVWHAFLAYFGSIFIGLLTPGRLGEFVKALHVSYHSNISSARAFATVLLDRFFDLYALSLVGGASILAAGFKEQNLWFLFIFFFLLTIPLILFLHEPSFGVVQRIAGRLPWPEKVGNRKEWILDLRRGMLQVSWPVLLAAIGLTVAAYGIFFVQCYLLALALNLSLNFTTVVYAVALGSLVTLLPLSISGLGTREATIVYYLGLQGISSSAALGFSLTLFIVFYVGGSLFGMIAWWLEPIPMDGLSRRLVSRSAIENYGDG